MPNFYSIFLCIWKRVIFLLPFFGSLWDVCLGISFLFSPFSSYFAAFYADGSYYFGRLLVGVFFIKGKGFCWWSFLVFQWIRSPKP